MSKHPRILLLVSTNSSYSREIVLGVTKYSALQGHWRFYIKPEWEDIPVSELAGIDADGIIAHASPVYMEELVKLNIPLIMSVSDAQLLFPEVPMILGDNEQISKIAVSYLAGRGFKNLAYLPHDGFKDLIWSKERYDSFRIQALELGIEVQVFSKSKSHARCSWEKEIELLGDWIRSVPKPIAVLAASDERGQVLLEACDAYNVKVPHEVAVLGVNNDQVLCSLSVPPLSSIALNAERAGFEAAECLDRMMKKQQLPYHRIMVNATGVVTRRSTDVFAVEDTDIQAGLQYISDHANDMIQVEDVVSAAAVSRRLLEKKFRMVLNHTIYDEIKRVRIQHIQRLLTETNETVAKIATQQGYMGIKNISRFFQQETGMTPLEYRKKYGRK